MAFDGKKINRERGDGCAKREEIAGERLGLSWGIRERGEDGDGCCVYSY